MANFAEVSETTNVVHNVILEFLVGMGVFSSVFFLWLYKAFRYLINTRNIMLVAVLISIFTNFLFDTTYVIVGMLWLWFATLGIVEK